MSAKNSEWYIGERVLALAVMHLTRRKDLILKQEIREPDQVLDLVVDINDPSKIGRRRFGVYLQGTKTPVTVEEANNKLALSLRRFQGYGEAPYPFCLFYFTMDDDQGYFTWVAEPMVEGGRPKLRYHEKAHCDKLDREVLDQIVLRVHAWYDAFYSTIKV